MHESAHCWDSRLAKSRLAWYTCSSTVNGCGSDTGCPGATDVQRAVLDKTFATLASFAGCSDLFPDLDAAAQRLLLHRPDDPVHVTCRGQVLAAMGRLEEALPYLLRAVDQVAGDDLDRTAIRLVEAIGELRRTELYPLAEHLIAALRSKYFENPYTLAVLDQRDTDRYPLADIASGRLVEHDLGVSQYWRARGWLLAETGRAVEGLAVLRGSDGIIDPGGITGRAEMMATVALAEVSVGEIESGRRRLAEAKVMYPGCRMGDRVSEALRAGGFSAE